jgi:transcriptional regulator with XRE-family HTH domain
MSNDICTDFGRRLRQLRVKRKLSQEELAYRVGMDVSYLSEVENGRKEPCLRKIKELAQGLDITLSSMMRGL